MTIKLDIDNEQNFIDLWNPEKNKWERYIKCEEENKKIKKLNIYHYFTSLGIDNTGRLDENLTDISNKINEIIDKINELEEK